MLPFPTQPFPETALNTPGPKKIYTEITTYCNLRCPMCVKCSPASNIREAMMPFVTFQRLEEALGHADALVLNGIGEPLLHPDLPAMIEMARHSMAQGACIGLQSNGLLLDEAMASQLLRSGLNRLCLSLDGLAGNPAGKNGHGENHPQSVFQALASIQQAKQAIRPADFQFGVEVVLMKDNIAVLPDLVEKVANSGADFILASHLLAYHFDIESQSLFNPNTDRATRLFARYQEMAKQQGISLTEGIHPLWNNPKDEQSRKIYTLLQQLRDEAGKKDIPLNLKSLAQWFNQDSRQTEKSCLEAKELAAALKISLELPETQALENRCCRFIEDRAAFITPEGDVMPCHALWHSYSCYMDGEEKRIAAKKLGNINEQSLEAIWNTQLARGFRRNASRYDYPFCRSCALGPCPDVSNQSYPFTNDCYGSTVPCGHCMWCLGGIRCL